MTKQEFENLVERANLSQVDDELFEIVNEAVLSLKTLDDYDGAEYGSR